MKPSLGDYILAGAAYTVMCAAFIGLGIAGMIHWGFDSVMTGVRNVVQSRLG